MGSQLEILPSRHFGKQPGYPCIRAVLFWSGWGSLRRVALRPGIFSKKLPESPAKNQPGRLDKPAFFGRIAASPQGSL